MKKILAILSAAIVFFTAACHHSADGGNSGSVPPADETEPRAADRSSSPKEDNTSEQPLHSDEESNQNTEESVSEEENDLKIEIKIGERAFSAALYDNETTKAFRELLPLSLDMNELNGNEKFYNLSEALPTNAGRPAKICTGDIMLFGSDCLVLFYEDFTTSYSYTPIGRIGDPDGLAAALGGGNVRVDFQG